MEMDEFLNEVMYIMHICNHEICMKHVLKEFPFVPTGNTGYQTGAHEDDGAP